MSELDKYKDHFVLFLEAGFIAVNQADEDAALKLFKAAEILKPENTLPKVGYGYLHLHKLELNQACDVFNEILSKEPENEMAKTFLGICMSLMPDKGSEGEKILTESAKKASDKEVKEAADMTLDFVEKFVKKTPSPADIQKGKNT